MTPFPSTTNHVYHIDDGESFWFVAESAAHARELYDKDFGDPVADDQPAVTQLPDDKELTIRMDDSGDEGAITLTAREWAASEGVGCIAATCW